MAVVSKSIEKIIDAAFDPESVTLLEGVYDVLSHAIISGVTSTITQGIGVIPNIGFHFLGSTGITSGKDLGSQLLNKFFADTYKSMAENFVKGMTGTFSTGLRSAILTGDGTQDAADKFGETVGLGSLTAQLTKGAVTWMGQLGAVLAVDKLTGGNMDPNEGILKNWLGLRKTGYQSSSASQTGNADLTGHSLADGRSYLEIVGSVWGSPDFAISGSEWGSGVAVQMVSTAGQLTTQAIVGVLQTAVTGKKLNASSLKAGALETTSEAGVTTGLDVNEGEKTEETAKKEDDYEGAVSDAVKTLFEMGQKLVGLAEAAKLAAEAVALSQPVDMVKLKDQQDTIVGIQKTLDDAFSDRNRELLKEASVGDAARVDRELPVWKQKIADAKQKVDTLLASPPPSHQPGPSQVTPVLATPPTGPNSGKNPKYNQTMDPIPPDLKRLIEKLTGGLSAARLSVHIATATLPVAEGVQQALQFWHAHLPLAFEASGKPLQGFTVSLAASLERVTWHAVGAAPEFTFQMMDYLDELDIPQENLVDLEQVLDAVQPAQLGSWITGRKNSYDLGWYLAPREGLLENALPLLPESPDRDRLAEWAAQHEVSECVRLGRSLVSAEQLSDMTVKIEADTPRQAVETGLSLLGSLALPLPPDEVLEAALHHKRAETFASLWLGRAGAAKVGLLLPEPSTELVLRLCDAVGQGHVRELALFEGALDCGGPAFAELQQLADGWGVELHYTVQG